jgi:UDP-glucose 4-epimerase
LAGVKKIVLASTAALYGPDAPLPVHEHLPPDPRTPYAAGKWQNEKDAARFVEQGLGEAVCLRFFNVYGPKQSADSPYAGAIAKAMMAARLGLPFTVFGDGEQTRDFIHVHDVARAISHALFTAAFPYGTYNIATGHSVTLNHILGVLETVSGGSITVNREPARHGDIRHSSASVGAAARHLGFQAAITLADGLRQTWFSHPLAVREGGRS